MTTELPSPDPAPRVHVDPAPVTVVAAVGHRIGLAFNGPRGCGDRPIPGMPGMASPADHETIWNRIYQELTLLPDTSAFTAPKPTLKRELARRSAHQQQSIPYATAPTMK